MFPSKMTTTAAAAVWMAFAGLAGGAFAQESAPAAPAATEAPARDPDAVVAKVGDETVTENEVTLAEEAFASEAANIPEAQRRGALIDALISMKLLALAGREEGLGDGPEFAKRIAFMKEQALRNAYVEKAIVNGVTDEDLQKGYQTLVVDQHKPVPQVHARHILVETKEEAQKIIDDLKGGASFEELAKQSKDPSGQNGGDLGFFGEGQMVPEFEKAAFALEPGQTTEEPVQTKFGWHVIKVEEKRMSTPPTFDEVKDQLKTYLVRQKFEDTLTALRDKFTVEIVDTPAAPAADAPKQ